MHAGALPSFALKQFPIKLFSLQVWHLNRSPGKILTHEKYLCSVILVFKRNKIKYSDNNNKISVLKFIDLRNYYSLLHRPNFHKPHSLNLLCCSSSHLEHLGRARHSNRDRCYALKKINLVLIDIEICIICRLFRSFQFQFEIAKYQSKRRSILKNKNITHQQYECSILEFRYLPMLGILPMGVFLDFGHNSLPLSNHMPHIHL